jgi:hypothetical protein
MLRLPYAAVVRAVAFELEQQDARYQLLVSFPLSSLVDHLCALLSLP